MATITTRPSELSAVGGTFPNDIIYTLTTSNDYEQMELWDSVGVLVSNVLSFANTGVIELNLAGILASYLEAKISIQNATFIDALFAKEFYLKGTGFNDVANKRIAVASKLDAISANFGAYQIYNTGKFASAFEVVPQFADCFLSIYNNIPDTDILYFKVIEYDFNEILLSENMTLLDFSKGFLRVFVAFTLLASCAKKDCVLLTAEQLVPNYHFKTGNTGWIVNRAGTSLSNVGGTLMRITGSAVSSADVTNTVSCPAGEYIFEIKLRQTVATVGDLVAVATLPNGDVHNITVKDNGEFVVFNTNFTVASGTATDLSVYFSITIASAVIEIDYISITSLPTAQTEIKSLEQRRECNLSALLTWVSPIGGWEHYAFQKASFGAKTVGQSKEYQRYGQRFETVAQASSRKTLSVATIVPLADLQGLSTILSSPEVYLKTDNDLTYCKLLSNSITLGDEINELYEVNFEFELPYFNS